MSNMLSDLSDEQLERIAVEQLATGPGLIRCGNPDVCGVACDGERRANWPTCPDCARQELVERRGEAELRAACERQLATPEAGLLVERIVADARTIRRYNRQVFHMAGRVGRLEAENARLAAIVARLPVTADGVPITPGMVLHQVFDYCGGSWSEPHELKPLAGCSVDGRRRVTDLHFPNGWTAIVDCKLFSTLEAAEQFCRGTRRPTPSTPDAAKQRRATL